MGRLHFTFLGSSLNLNPNLNPLLRLKIKSKIRIKIKKSEKTAQKMKRTLMGQCVTFRLAFPGRRPKLF
jgi:hypothetical protein